jgi:hypothetical protein
MDGYVDRSTLTPIVRLKLISAMEEEIELNAILGTLLLADCELDINFKDGWAKIEQLVSKT